MDSGTASKRRSPVIGKLWAAPGRRVPSKRSVRPWRSGSVGILLAVPMEVEGPLVGGSVATVDETRRGFKATTSPNAYGPGRSSEAQCVPVREHGWNVGIPDHAISK